jgi:hypothetical protein
MQPPACTCHAEHQLELNSATHAPKLHISNRSATSLAQHQLRRRLIPRCCCALRGSQPTAASPLVLVVVEYTLNISSSYDAALTITPHTSTAPSPAPLSLISHTCQPANLLTHRAPATPPKPSQTAFTAAHTNCTSPQLSDTAATATQPSARH